MKENKCRYNNNNYFLCTYSLPDLKKPKCKYLGLNKKCLFNNRRLK